MTNRSTERTEKANEVIKDLMRELEHAYHGLTTLPVTHPARVAYATGWKFLEGK